MTVNHALHGLAHTATSQADGHVTTCKGLEMGNLEATLVAVLNGYKIMTIIA